MVHILVVEDEPELCQQLCRTLSYQGYTVTAVNDGEPALAAQRASPADIILLDLMLPGMDGFKVIQNLRNENDLVPVIMLTARTSEADRVKGLTLGCDDYLGKPFSILELLARIQAILRRTRNTASPEQLQVGSLVLDRQAMTVTKDGAKVDLTAKEFRILELLLACPGSTFSRQEIVNRAWAADAQPSLRTVDSHIKNLRKKLGDDDQNKIIATVGGEGYRWVSSFVPKDVP